MTSELVINYYRVRNADTGEMRVTAFQGVGISQQARILDAARRAFPRDTITPLARDDISDEIAQQISEHFARTGDPVATFRL